ncbi:MAG: hypothetical protein KKA30_14665 [Alphaproteobacteria bacterium]|nr:hypothetical protein [Alphaproteobacteria bacterium]
MRTFTGSLIFALHVSISQTSTLKHLLPEAELAAVFQGLSEAFHGLRRHDLWDSAGRPICADPKEERLITLRGADLDQLAFGDLDYLMSCAGLTIGSRETVRFLTPRYLRALLSFPGFGWYTNGRMLRDRMERFGFDEWPRDQRLATANGLALMGRAMFLMADEYNLHGEADGAELIAWADAKRSAAIGEAEARAHKAGVRKAPRIRKPSGGNRS